MVAREAGEDWRAQVARRLGKQRPCRLEARTLDSITPISRLATLMCDCKDLRPIEIIFVVHDCVREAIEVVDAQAIFATRATLLIFDKEAAAIMRLTCVA